MCFKNDIIDLTSIHTTSKIYKITNYLNGIIKNKRGKFYE